MTDAQVRALPGVKVQTVLGAWKWISIHNSQEEAEAAAERIRDLGVYQKVKVE